MLYCTGKRQGPGERAYGPGFIESENRVIVQKNFRDDRLVLAANLTYAPEFRHVSDDNNLKTRIWQEETDANIDLGATYRFRCNWSLGFELINEREFNSFNFTHESNSGYYLGPTIHYGGKHFFATATFIEQMPWASSHVDTVPGALVDGRLYDNDFERFRVRLRFGGYFGREQ